MSSDRDATLSAIRAKLAAISKWPWSTGGHCCRGDGVTQNIYGPRGEAQSGVRIAADMRVPDAEFIASSPESVALLLEENARQATQIRALNEAITWALGAHLTLDFEPREPGDGAYWWRRKLHKLADAANPGSLSRQSNPKQDGQ